MEEQTQIDDDFTDEDKVESNLKLWDYKENDTIIGLVKELVSEEDGLYGRTIIVDTNEDEGITIPSLTALQSKLNKVIVGDKVKIINLGLVKSGKSKNSYYDFDVFIKRKI